MENLNTQLPQYDHKTYQRDEVYQTLESFAEAIREGDINHIMSFYSDDIIAYDMMPPLEFEGKDKYQKSWQECFTNYFKFPVNFNYEKQKFTIDGDVAFTHALVHMSGEQKNGEEKVDMWMRNTTCLKKFGDKWLITHEHNSIPLDNEMKGVTNLHPENLLH
jgi:ketosteroid isomerase-like protein